MYIWGRFPFQLGLNCFSTLLTCLAPFEYLCQMRGWSCSYWGGNLFHFCGVQRGVRVEWIDFGWDCDWFSTDHFCIQFQSLISSATNLISCRGREDFRLLFCIQWAIEYQLWHSTSVTWSYFSIKFQIGRIDFLHWNVACLFSIYPHTWTGLRLGEANKPVSLLFLYF